MNKRAWEACKNEARAVMIAHCRRQRTLAYSDLAAAIQSDRFEPHDTRLFQLLGEISTEEYKAGRGMLSAIIVHKTGDFKPGPGFFNLARELGATVRDDDAFWVKQLNHVFAHWRAAA